MKPLLDKVKVIANSWGESLEPPANKFELQHFVDRVQENFGVRFPDQYETFLQIVNGLEFNGLIIYGTKNSENDLGASSLDLFEMNEVLKDSLRASKLDLIAIGEDSTGLITYDLNTKKFQFRDRIGLDKVEPFSSFEEMLKVVIEKVM
jgi:hypothetical protein